MPAETSFGRRVRKLSKYLGLIIDGTRPSEFLDAARKEWGEKGHMKMSNLLHQCKLLLVATLEPNLTG